VFLFLVCLKKWCGRKNKNDEEGKKVRSFSETMMVSLASCVSSPSSSSLFFSRRERLHLVKATVDGRNQIVPPAKDQIPNKVSSTLLHFDCVWKDSVRPMKSRFITNSFREIQLRSTKLIQVTFWSNLYFGTLRISVMCLLLALGDRISWNQGGY